MFLSTLIGKPVQNKSDERIGRVVDVVVANINSRIPAVSGFILSRGHGNSDFFIPVSDFLPFSEKPLQLNTDTVNFTPFERRQEEVLLSKYILDKQIVDVKERHLTRINDIELQPSNGNLFVHGVDVSFRSILHRLGLPTWGFMFKYNPISWQDIQFLGVDLPVKVKIDYDRLESLNPTDIARFIFNGPEINKSTRIIQSLEEDIAADVVESLPLDFQVNIIEHMSTAAAGKILSEMESHHAADLLAELGESQTAQLLDAMNHTQATSVKELLTYPEGTAGAIMKVEYISVPQTMTVEELTQHLRTLPKLPEFLLYFYIVESAASKKLVGVVSIWEFFKGEPRTRLEKIMIKDYIFAHPLDRKKSVLKKLVQYDLSAIPIVNNKKHMVGIVTISHAVKLLVPKSWQTGVSESG